MIYNRKLYLKLYIDNLIIYKFKPCYKNMELVGNDVIIVNKNELNTLSQNLFSDKN